MVFLPHIGNCSKYHVCVNNTPVDLECESGYLFDVKNQSCVNPKLAKCMPTCTAALSSFCYDKTCTKYVLCYDGLPIVRECCDGLQYNAQTDRCDFPQFVDCVDNMCNIFNDPKNIKFLSSKAACDKYFICMDGSPHSLTCSNGLQFNPKCSCCDFPSNTKCNVTAIKRNIIPYSKSPPLRADLQCPETGVHFKPHAKNDSYYFCVNGSGVVLECTPGLFYDPILETCREQKYID